MWYYVKKTNYPAWNMAQITRWNSLDNPVYQSIYLWTDGSSVLTAEARFIEKHFWNVIPLILLYLIS